MFTCLFLFHKAKGYVLRKERREAEMAMEKASKVLKPQLPLSDDEPLDKKEKGLQKPNFI